ncbi:MAG: DUF2141 domain-containing protein [Sphingobium sp.]
MRPVRIACVALAAALIGAAPADLPQPLSMDVQGLRSARGAILICVTQAPDHFPDCTADPNRRHFAVPASGQPIALGMLAPGSYAIALIHDENGNGRLDTMLGIPREGVGFSGNPAIRFGAPSFRSARFVITGAPMRQDVRVKYFL